MAKPTTLAPLNLDFEALLKRGQDASAFRTALLAKLAEHRANNTEYYRQRANRASCIVNGSRWVMAALGAAAILFTAIAAIRRILITNPADRGDVDWLVAALVTYALMGAWLFFDKTADYSTRYFRHLATQFSIRDLWNRFEAAVLKQALASSDASDSAADLDRKKQVFALAEAFSTDLDKLTSAEFAQWQTEFTTSLSELEAAAKGATEIEKKLQEGMTSLTQALDRARQDAAGGAFNVEIAGEFDGKITLTVDDTEKITTHLRKFPIAGIAPGLRRIAVKGAKTGVDREAAALVQVVAGLQAAPLKLELA